MAGDERLEGPDGRPIGGDGDRQVRHHFVDPAIFRA
jgi:hypothetical protein